MCDKNECMKIFSGYTVIALKSLGYSDKNIKDIIMKIENLRGYILETKATEVINQFLNDIDIQSLKSNNTNLEKEEIIFESIKIPIEYNLVKINDLLEQYGFLGSEYNYLGRKICSALKQAKIIYLKDLYGKTEKNIKRIKTIGEISYRFFIQALEQIFLNK